MDWNVLAPLIGVALGALIPLIGVVLTTRTTKAQAHRQWLDTSRAERKVAIVDFIREAQADQNFLSRLWRNATGLEGMELDREMSRSNSELWLVYYKLDLVAGKELRKAALALTERLDDAMYKRPESIGTIWEYIDEHQDRFFDAARGELDNRVPSTWRKRIVRRRPASGT